MRSRTRWVLGEKADCKQSMIPTGTLIIHNVISSGTLTYINKILTSVISTGLTTTGSSSVRPRLYTAASTEIHIRVVIGSKTFSLLTSTLNQVQSLKTQIEEKSGQPADCQLLRLNDKLLVMDSFHLSDYHVMENSTIYVQVHPWDEEYDCLFHLFNTYCVIVIIIITICHLHISYNTPFFLPPKILHNLCFVLFFS